MAIVTEGRVIFRVPDRVPVSAHLTVAAFALVWFTATRVGGADAPIVVVHPDRIVPDRIQVHLGELVTWQAPSGGALRLELDPHPSAHEVVVRAGRIAAYFRTPGDHWYRVSLERGARRQQLRGIVVVAEKAEPEPFTTCAPESSGRICFEP